MSSSSAEDPPCQTASVTHTAQSHTVLKINFKKELLYWIIINKSHKKKSNTILYFKKEKLLDT